MKLEAEELATKPKATVMGSPLSAYTLVRCFGHEVPTVRAPLPTAARTGTAPLPRPQARPPQTPTTCPIHPMHPSPLAPTPHLLQQLLHTDDAHAQRKLGQVIAPQLRGILGWVGK